jgi:peptidoglycan hydrolase-like protein with peptidoglycan-binding domain
MRRIFVLSAALLALPASASAAPGKRLHVASGIRDGQRVYVMKGQRVLIEGARPFAEQGLATASVRWRGREVARMRSPLRGSAGAEAGVRLRFTARRPGTYRVVVKVFKEPDEQTPVVSTPLAVRAIRPRAHFGWRGLSTRLLQRGLRALAYVTPVNGRYDDATGRAVLAFRKVNGMARTESASWAVFKKLFRGLGGFGLKHPGAGKHVEFDWSRQVLAFARGGRPVRIYHSSSGKPSTPTVFGSFRFYLKTPGTNAHGMVDSNYFIGGYAVHGYVAVPPYAASHGCIRVPIPDAASIYHWIHIGDRIFVYR